MIQLVAEARSNSLANIDHKVKRAIENMNKQGYMLENTTSFTSLVFSSSLSTPPIRTRAFGNVIYLTGIGFMVIVFLLLLWVNLFSQRCWCWHDTPVVNRFNRRWLLKRSMANNANRSTSSKDPQSRRTFEDDELE